MAALSGAERGRELLSLWVRKEALLKAAGIGMAIEMDRFEAPADRVLALPGDVRTGSAVIRLFDGAEGCMAAVDAAPGPIARVWLTHPDSPRTSAAPSRRPFLARWRVRLARTGVVLGENVEVR